MNSKKAIIILTLIFSSLWLQVKIVVAGNLDYSSKCKDGKSYWYHNGTGQWSSECSPGYKFKVNGIVYATCVTCDPPCENTATYGACNTSCGAGTKSYTDTCTGVVHSADCSNYTNCAGVCGADYADSDNCGVVSDIDENTSGLCDGTNNEVKNLEYDAEKGKWTWDCEGTGSTATGCCATIEPGTCGDGDGNNDNGTTTIAGGEQYNYNTSEFPDGFEFCKPVKATHPFVNFPSLTGNNPSPSTVSWDCSTPTGGTEGGKCKVTLNPPTVECDTPNGQSNINTKPQQSEYNLCKVGDGFGGSVTVDPEVKLDSNGKWTWGCKHNPFSGIIASPSCEASSCIVDAVSAVSPIMLADNMTSTVKVSCPNDGGGEDKLCCTINNGRVSGFTGTVVCTGDPQEVPIAPGINTLDPHCWFESDDKCVGGTSNEVCEENDDEDEDGADPDDVIVRTACVASQCTTGGTCAKTPQFAESKSECKTSCSSNADCTSGHLIETKP